MEGEIGCVLLNVSLRGEWLLSGLKLEPRRYSGLPVVVDLCQVTDSSDESTHKRGVNSQDSEGFASVHAHYWLPIAAGMVDRRKGRVHR